MFLESGRKPVDSGKRSENLIDQFELTMNLKKEESVSRCVETEYPVYEAMMDTL